MKVEGTAEVIMGEMISPEPKSEEERWTKETVKMTLEGSADAILTVLQELKTNQSLLRNFKLR